MKKLFIVIYILTILDAIATVSGVQMGFIEEANPFVQKAMMYHPLITGLASCIVVGAVLYLIYRVRHKVGYLIYLMSIVLAVKTIIIGMHINWIAQII